MSNQQNKNLQHGHDFSNTNLKGERRTAYVLVLTAVTMVVEVISGSLFGSMALLADGWHMGTHLAAFLITIFAYRYARKHTGNPEFSFGTGKVNVLGGFASAVALAVVALVMLVESVQKFFQPLQIRFNEAILVAAIGLLVNLISAYLLRDETHEHDHHHGHDHDHNLKAAYLHVLADAMTSLLAIAALFSGKFFGWNWLDPVMGMVGAVVITRWSINLVRSTAPILLDKSIDLKTQQEIISLLEKKAGTKVTDIHIWRLSAGHYGAIISLAAKEPLPVDVYREMLARFTVLSHLTIEVNPA